MKIKFLEYVTMLTLSVGLFACEKTCEVSIVAQDETINGITVKWRSQISAGQKNTIRDILNDMVLVEGDYFVMGATPEQENYARSNEYPNSYVRLSDYYICKYEVTDEQYNSIMDASKSASTSYSSRISLEEWKQFILVLQDMTSLKFSLPSEAQWEFAARGGKQSKGYVYPGSNVIEDVRTLSFLEGSDMPNELGLYNMADLKSEWCIDLYASLVSDNLLIDWVQDSGKANVVRGGNFLCSIESDKYSSKQNVSSYRLGSETTSLRREMDYRNCRTTSRAYYNDANTGNDCIGCRLVINIR